ncbi:amino acid permease [Antarcticibacterium flavum]|uniref:Amino acid permease n=2 Tax=Flavobacteriaceae TaxID=49546 RepID=A0A5B7X7C9_9FLAO|nr:amino acid permease [Antarcticibacterium sp. W02-3]QCY71374.1 amino acid permease [Antarcticibacterium flavum]
MPPIHTSSSFNNITKKEDKQENLLRTIGIFGLSTNIINIIVGSGIFVLPAIVAAGMGAGGIIAYLFCGLLIGLIMLCFAEVGSKITTTGGLYTYIETAFGKYAGFLSGNLYLMAVLAADAAVSNALVNILAVAFPLFESQIIRLLFLLIIFLGLAGFNILGIKQGIGLVKLLVVAKILPLLLLVIIGSFKIEIASISIETWPEFGQLGTTSLVLFFAFMGGETGLNVSGEVKKPNKNIPRAIFAGITTVVVLYVFIQLVAQGVLGDELADQNAPLAETAARVFGSQGFMLLTAGAAVSMFGYLSGSILNMPRVVYALSRDRVIPVKAFSKVHSRFKTPHLAILTYAVAGFVIAAFGTFEKLAVIATGGLLLQYLGVALAVIKLRYTRKSRPGEFKIPGGLIVPLLSVGIIAYFLSKMTYAQAMGTLAATILLTIIYIINRKISIENKNTKKL